MLPAILLLCCTETEYIYVKGNFIRRNIDICNFFLQFHFKMKKKTKQAPLFPFTFNNGIEAIIYYFLTGEVEVATTKKKKGKMKGNRMR